ncbi:MAG: DNA polymerase III subunit beta [Bacteroidetes bacterium]|nr:DNA polymerase III subunit beta [Bacteroidota bacterium]
MKFIASTSALLKQLQLINGVISTNTVLPILEDFLFEIKSGKLTISATDLETSMSTEMDIESKEDGKIAIPAKILLDTLKTLPDQPLTFSVDEQSYGIEITTDNGKFKLAGENGDDFPRIPAAENVTNTSIPGSVLNKAINKTLFAVSTDELRPAMTGVYFELGGEGMTFVATDAHKLVKYSRSDIKSEEGSSFIVPKKALTLLKGALPEEEDVSVNIAYNTSNAFFSFENVNLICRLIDARYPDYNAVIPEDNPNTLTISKADLTNTLKRIAIYANKTTYQVLMKISGSELNISAQDLDFSNEANERLTCQYEGEDIEIGFNARFLIEMVSVVDTDDINMELSTPTRAGIILPTDKDENEDILMLVMPVMLNT